MIVVVVVSAALLVPAHPVTDHPFFLHGERAALAIAHRGSVLLWPENTLYAFEIALALGADVIETDIRTTADGVLVLLHDANVDRTTEGTGPVRALTLAELTSLDAGYRWSPDGGRSFPYRGHGLRVPTLEELFTAFPQARMNLEIKENDPAIATALCRSVREHRMSERVLVASFHPRAVSRFRDVCPGVATSATAPEARRFLALSTLRLENLHRPAAWALQVPEFAGRLRVLTPRFVAAAHRLNLQVHAFTINEPENQRRLLELGVDGIVTDRPDRMLTLLGRAPSEEAAGIR
jgi:glycerophosphoryl diester phosphodiesterase